MSLPQSFSLVTSINLSKLRVWVIHPQQKWKILFFTQFRKDEARR